MSVCADEATLGGDRVVHASTSDAEFVTWVRPHWTAMQNVAGALSAGADRDDVLQEAVVLAWRRFDQFDSSRGSARGWLVAITANVARKSHRRKKPEHLLQPAELHVDADLQVDLERAIDGLPRRQREAVRLYYYAALPIDQIATAMSCAPGTVKSSLSAARGNLQRLLGKEYLT